MIATPKEPIKVVGKGVLKVLVVCEAIVRAQRVRGLGVRDGDLAVISRHFWCERGWGLGLGGGFGG